MLWYNSYAKNFKQSGVSRAQSRRPYVRGVGNFIEYHKTNFIKYHKKKIVQKNQNSANYRWLISYVIRQHCLFSNNICLFRTAFKMEHHMRTWIIWRARKWIQVNAHNITSRTDGNRQREDKKLWQISTYLLIAC